MNVLLLVLELGLILKVDVLLSVIVRELTDSLVVSTEELISLDVLLIVMELKLPIMLLVILDLNNF